MKTHRTSKPSFARLCELERRQGNAAFGKDYMPGLLVGREESSGFSQPHALFSKKFGRDLHSMSWPETKFMASALYIPELKELHEQKVLSVAPAPHPLTGYPGVINVLLPEVRGTVKVAEKLGVLKLHPLVAAMYTNDAGEVESTIVPYPYLGDLLLFLVEGMEIYCVNWNIKAEPEDFKRSGPGKRARSIKEQERLNHEAQARHLIEEAYYRDAGIRTEHLAGSMVDDEVVRNLLWLHDFDNNEVTIADDVNLDMISHFRADLKIGLRPLETILRLAKRHACEIHICKTALYRAILHRELRVDLYHPIYPDRPLRPEQRDFLAEIQPWYRK